MLNRLWKPPLYKFGDYALESETSWKLTRWILSLSQCTGWHRALLLIGAGALAATGHAPLHFVPFTSVALILLIWLLDSINLSAFSKQKDEFSNPNRGWRLFLVGWYFGVGYFLAGFYWITLSFLVVSPGLGLVAPFAAIALAAGLGLFTGATTWLYGLPNFTKTGRLLWFALSWLAVEWLRSILFTGLPWNLAAYLWPGITIGQISSVIGTHGLSLLTLIILIAPAALLQPVYGGKLNLRLHPTRCSGLYSIGLALAILGALIGFGLWRLESAGPTLFTPGIKLRLVQPSIPQREKWKRDLKPRNFQTYLQMTAGPGFDTITHVIWPETAAAMVLANQPAALRALGAVTPKAGFLITGTIQHKIMPQKSGIQSNLKIYNGLHAINAGGEIIASYAKNHLVPFGEFMPLGSILPFRKLTDGGRDFSTGAGLTTLNLPGLPPFSPLICYEIIFPNAIIAPDSETSPRWLLNLTNDAWFGRSSGPYQHLYAARMRAIEYGLPLVRSANTGISAIFDGFGRETGRIDLKVAAVLDGGLPEPTENATLFSRWRHIPVLILLIFGLSFGIVARKRSKKDADNTL